MSYDEGLAGRLRVLFAGRTATVEKKMFGGLAFMHRGHMLVGILGNTLMARVGPSEYRAALNQPHVREMDFTGKPLKGYVYIEPAAIESDAALQKWVALCLQFNASLAAK